MAAEVETALLAGDGSVQRDSESDRGTGSAWAALANNFKALFGAGVLSMPKAFSRVGLPLALLSFGVVFAVCVVTMLMLVRAMQIARRSDPSLVSYADLAGHACGRGARRLVQFFVVFLELAFCTGFVIVILDNLSQMGVSRWAVVAVLAPMLVVLSWVRFLRDLWALSLFGLVVYIGGVVGGSLHDSLAHWDAPADADEWDWGGWALFIGTAAYGLDGINLILPIANSVGDPRDVDWVVVSSMTGYAVLVGVYAAVTYAAGLGTCDVVTDCLVSQTMRSVVRIALSVALVLTHPVTLFPATEIIEASLGSGGSLGKAQSRAVRAAQALVTVLVGAVVPSFSLFSDFVGAIGLTLAGFILPPIIYLSVVPERSPVAVAASACFVVFGLFTMGIGTYTSVAAMV